MPSMDIDAAEFTRQLEAMEVYAKALHPEHRAAYRAGARAGLELAAVYLSLFPYLIPSDVPPAVEALRAAAKAYQET